MICPPAASSCLSYHVTRLSDKHFTSQLPVIKEITLVYVTRYAVVDQAIGSWRHIVLLLSCLKLKIRLLKKYYFFSKMSNLVHKLLVSKPYLPVSECSLHTRDLYLKHNVQQQQTQTKLSRFRVHSTHDGSCAGKRFHGHFSILREVLMADGTETHS